MRPLTGVLIALLVSADLASAQGLLIPIDRKVPPLAMRSHRVNVTLEDQVAITNVEQTFRNHTDRPLEATYIFPVPRGASVREFAMWVDGKKVKGELIEAKKAKQIYTDIVRRILDPGLLEYLGTDLLQMKVFPVPARGEQKVEVSYTSLARKDNDVVEYTYPVRTDGKATSTLEDFTLKLTLKSQHPIHNIFSPTHAVSIARPNDREAIVGFEKHQCLLDRDFQLVYSVGGKDIGMTLLMHRPNSSEDGYFMLLMSPRPELSSTLQVPRDLVFVLDTSGSMAENGKLEQAKKALTHCLRGLTDRDRFALIQFATTVNPFSTGMVAVTRDNIDDTIRRVDKLEAVGGTVINDALEAALDMLKPDDGRSFNVVFFTDGKPTLGEIVPDRILENVRKKNKAQARFFIFGVGHDLNAAFLDQLAEQSRGVTTFVRPGEDLSLKASRFFDTINRPVLTNLKLKTGKNIHFTEMYPPHLPDLFHGSQLVVLGRYHGAGDTALTLSGRIGKEHREFVHDAHFHATADSKPFVEDLWARRKVGYLLEQIRLHGEKKELVDSVITLAKRYGIATPYTSYLVVPDSPIPIVRPQPPIPRLWPRPWLETPQLLQPSTPGGMPRNLADAAREMQKKAGTVSQQRAEIEDRRFAKISPEDKSSGFGAALSRAKDQMQLYQEARRVLKNGSLKQLHIDKLGVDYSVQMAQLKNQTQVQQSAQRFVGGRTLLEIGGVWLDTGFTSDTPVVTVKAMSDAYFRILELRPAMKDVVQLGNHIVWMTPSGTALVIDATAGEETMTDEAITRLFRGK